MQTEMTVSCPVCQATALRVTASPRQVTAEDGTDLSYTDQLMQCENCGERFYTREQAAASSRARVNALRLYERLLTPDQVVAVRGKHRLSQADLETLLELGEKTVVRWERGTVCQSRAADKLLRLLDSMGPTVLRELTGTSNLLEPLSSDRVATSGWFFYNVTVNALPAVTYNVGRFLAHTKIGRFSGEWDIANFTHIVAPPAASPGESPPKDGKEEPAEKRAPVPNAALAA